jgi:two-component system, sensor histidine kinase
LQVTDCELALAIIYRPKKGEGMAERDPTADRNQRDWIKAALQPAMLLYLLMIPALWAALTVILLIEQKKILDAAVLQGSNLARLFEQNTTAMFQGVDHTLLLLRQEYERNSTKFDLSRLVKNATLGDDLTIQFAIAGQAGDAKGPISPNGTVAISNFADREWFQQQRDTKNDALVISKPIAGRLSKKLSIILSRRLRNFDGSFAGVIAASIGPQFMGSFYKTIDVGRRGSVILRDLDGVILAAGGTSGPVIGRQVMQPALRDALAISPSGHYWGGGAVDGVDRLVSYRTSQNLPIITMVGLAKGDIFAPYERTRLIYASTAVFLTSLLILGAVAGIRHRIRLDRSLAARQLAERKLERAKTFLDTVIEYLPLPVVVKIQLHYSLNS